MDTYQCPACGSTVTRAGCQRCGQPYDPDVAALALFKRTVAALEAKKRKLTNEQLLLRTQLAHASAQRDSLSRKIRDKAEAENPSARRPGRTLRRMITRRGGGSSSSRS